MVPSSCLKQERHIKHKQERNYYDIYTIQTEYLIKVSLISCIDIYIIIIFAKQYIIQSVTFKFYVQSLQCVSLFNFHN